MAFPIAFSYMLHLLIPLIPQPRLPTSPIPPCLNLHSLIAPISVSFFLRSSISHPLRPTSPLCLLPNSMVSKDNPRSKNKTKESKVGSAYERDQAMFVLGSAYLTRDFSSFIHLHAAE